MPFFRLDGSVLLYAPALFVSYEEIDAANAAALSGKLLQMANGAICNEEKSVLHGRSDVRRLGYILLPIKFAEAVRSSADG